jgi:hypothetical protein
LFQKGITVFFITYIEKEKIAPFSFIPLERKELLFVGSAKE